MPASYDRKRRIGAIKREAGTIAAFIQDGDFFQWKTPTLDVTTISTTDTLRTIRVPAGLPILARIVVQIANTGGAVTNTNHWDPALGTSLPSAPTGFGQDFVNTAVSQAFSRGMDVRTNSAGQIYNSSTSSAFTSYSISTQGYFDMRGRLY
ncbi:hypothetical protein EVB56_001 [Rhizobium phage RHph_Y1_10]|nr:hypothetical protein EVB56_001 [Rhizobium phage RHph_Y1_10]